MSTNPSQSNLFLSKIHKQTPKGLSNGRLGPLSVSKRSFKTQTALSKNVHPLIIKPVKWRAETCQLQAGRPTNFSVEPTQPPPPSRQDQERPREGRRQTEKILGQPASLGEAGRPHFATSRVHRRVEATSTDPLAYK